MDRTRPHGASKALIVVLMLIPLLPVAVAAQAGCSSRPLPEIAPSSTDSLVEGNTSFALDLYAELRGTEGNVVCSPFSISTALAMTYAGARGETASQMAGVLQFRLRQELIHSAFAWLRASLATDTEAEAPGVKLIVANRLWARPDERFLESFVETTRLHYGGAFEHFSSASPVEAQRQINTWVEERTNAKIRDLVEAQDLSPLPPLVLVNAIYFKGDWQTQFDPQRTRTEEFHIAPGSTVEARMMYQIKELGLYESDQLQVLELPYAGERFSMVVVLPRARDGLPALEEALTSESLDRWLTGLRQQSVHVALPRFRADYRARLAQVLSDLGMPIAFEERADFSGMDGGLRPLFIAQVIHQAFVEVIETGTEAAAATAVTMKRSSSSRPTTIRADHPFLFLIRDRDTGSVLFLGRVAEPSGPS